MVEAADAIAEYVARGRRAYDADSAVRDAILFRIVVIGEAAKTVVQRDPALAADLSEVEWSALARMRDRSTHQYWAVDAQIVWDTAIEEIPEVREPNVEQSIAPRRARHCRHAPRNTRHRYRRRSTSR